MARNKFGDLNNHLFAQLERLEDDRLSEQQMALEVKRTQAITKVASQVLNNMKLAVDVAKLSSDADFRKEELPDVLKLKQ